MDNVILNQMLPAIHTFGDYEKFKQHIEEDLARAIIHKHQLPEALLTLFSDGTNIVFYGSNKVIKILAILVKQPVQDRSNLNFSK